MSSKKHSGVVLLGERRDDTNQANPIDSIDHMDDIIVLLDEEGGEIECELLDRIEHKGSFYSVLLPVDADSAEPEAIILRENEAGDLEGFDDGDILDEVFKIFLQRNGIK